MALEADQLSIQTCHVCFDDKVPGFFLRCTHFYCADCLRQTLESAVRDCSLLPLKCCEEPIELTYWARRILPIGDADQLLAKMNEMETPNKMFCPSCNQFINLDLVDNSEHNILPCDCGSEMCVDCRTACHPDLTCSENMSALHGSDELVLHLASEKGWKQCPLCRMMIERVSGCNHMVCSNCKHPFCYKCRAEWLDYDGNLCISDACRDSDGDY